MGNHISIKNKDGLEIAVANLGLPCAAYFTQVARKYEPNFSMNTFGKTTEEINREINEIYNQASDEDKIIFCVFIFDEYEFGEKDISPMEKAISIYPESFNERPRIVLEKYLKLLKEHKTLKTEYINTTTAMTIKK